MTPNPPPARQRRKRRSKIARSEAADSEPEKVSGFAKRERSVSDAANGRPIETIRRRGTSRHTCPKCGGRLARIHRRFGDRLLSVFNPVRRYACTNHLCGHEAIFRKSSALGQRPVVAAAWLAAAAVAGAAVMGLGLYVASDESTRAAVRDAYTVQHDVASPHDPLPVLQEFREPLHEAVPVPGAKSETDELPADFMPPVPSLDSAPSPQMGESGETSPPRE